MCCPRKCSYIPSGGTVSDASVIKSDDVILTAERLDLSKNINEGGSIPSTLQNLVEFEPFFQEGYCKAMDVDGCCRLAEEVSDTADCSEISVRVKTQMMMICLVACFPSPRKVGL